MDKEKLVYDQDQQNGPIDLSIKSSEATHEHECETRSLKTSNNSPGIQTRAKKLANSESDGKWRDIARGESFFSVVSPWLIKSQKFDKTFLSVDSTAENTPGEFPSSPPLLPTTTIDSCPIVYDVVGKSYSLLELSDGQVYPIPLDSSASNISQKNYLIKYDVNEKDVCKSGNKSHSKLCGVNSMTMNKEEKCTYECCTKKHFGHLCTSKSSSRLIDRNLSTIGKTLVLRKNDLLSTPVATHNTQSSSILHSNKVTKHNTSSQETSLQFRNERECEDSSEEGGLPEDLSVSKLPRHLDDLISRPLTTGSQINCNRIRKSASFCDISRSTLEQEQNHILDMSKSKSDTETPASSPNPKISSSLYTLNDIDDNRSLMENRTFLKFASKHKYLKQKKGRQVLSKLLTCRPITLEVKGERSDNLQYHDEEPLTSHNWCQNLSTSPNDRNSFLEALHQIVPCGYPLNVYEYYTYLIQMYHSHEALKHRVGLTGTPAESVIPNNTSSSAPTSQTLESPEQDSPLLEGENVSCAAKKQPTRALTGKHVKYGTGASPSILLTLRQKIQERQKAKELAITDNVISNEKTEEAGRKRKKSSLSKHFTKRNRQQKNKENDVKIK